MMELISQSVQKAVAAMTPWLVGTAVGVFLFWFAMLIRERKPFAKEVKWFSGLAWLQKFIVVCAVGLFTFWGGSKERGILPSGLIDGISSTMSRVAETIQLRTLPEGVASNAFAITAFSVDSQDKTAHFGVGWSSNIFENVDSRNADLFMSTNLAASGWFWLGRYLMPTGTNSYGFTVSSNDVALACRPLYVDSFSRMAFFRFGLDFDSDGDGLTDAYENFVSFTDPANPDTDGDGLSDGAELSSGTGTNPLLYDTDGDGVGDGDEIAAGSNPRTADTDGDGLTDAEEIGTMAALAEDGFMWFDMSGGTRLITSQTDDGNSWKIPLPEGLVVNNTCHTNAKIHVDGTVHLMCPTNPTSWASACTYGTLSNSQYSACHVTVALCGADLYAKTNDWGSQILHGTVESGGGRYTVVEYRNIGLYACRDTSETVTCQLILPHDETNTIYVSYLCASNAFREADLRAGVQCGGIPSRKSGESCYNLAWPLTAKFPEDGLTIKYTIGTGTDPANSDTDLDGLTDCDETLIYHTDPLVADSDGDSIGDGEEVSANTDPLSADTDGDGMPDGWEVRYGLDPLTDDSASDLDGDGLCDGMETGGIFATNAIPWLVFDASEDLTTEISANNRRCVGRALPVPLRIQGETVTNLTISANGLVFLNKTDYANPGNSTSSANFKYSIDDDAFVLAPYLQYAYIRSDIANRQTFIKYGTATHGGEGYLLIEYLNSFYNNSSSQTNAISFQIAIPTNSPDRAYARYVDVSGHYMDGREASIGMQTFGGRWLHSWCCRTAGRVAEGLALEFLFGANTDPLNADTDGDGLTDGQEAGLGTSPVKADTDGDGLPDDWEVLYGLDPLTAEGADGGAGDPDGDGLDNVNEYELGTNPRMPDTDGDGLADGEEAVCVSFASPLPWLEIAPLTNLTDAITNSYSGCVGIDLPSPVTIQQEIVTNITIDANGVVYFNKAGYANPEYSRGAYDFEHSAIDTNCFTVAPYWSNLFLSQECEPSSVRFGTATVGTNGYYVLECLHLYSDLSSYETNSISFQLAFPTGRIDRISVRYSDIVGDEMDGRNASIGFQSFGAMESVSYCSWDRDMVYDGMGLSFVIGYGSDPTVADTDGDGLSDGEEVLTYGGDPRIGDTDGDGLPDAQEAILGTSLNNPDSDGDGLLDGWEVANSLNPLSATGDDGAGADIDGDGLTNLQEQAARTDPKKADTDGDGLSDSQEQTLGTNPTLADTDNDGLTDGEENAIGTNPLQSDTDGDGMNDGWEHQHINDGFDPNLNNINDNNPNTNPDADPDGDGLTNQQESEAGTSPVNPDTDGDGLNDGTEVGQGSDPNDRADTIPVKWVSVTGDLGEGLPKSTTETVTIPAGTAAYVGVFIHSAEYPYWTGQQSEYNDAIYWNVTADGQPPLTGNIRVNNEEVSWENAAAEGWSVNGFSPVAHKGGAIYRAGSSDLSVSVTLRAMNVRDGELPSSVIVGVFPLKVVQSNMPTATGVANTTDAATSYFRAQIPTNGVAYITAEPAAPQLTAQFKDLPQWIEVTWGMALVTERGDHRFGGIDDRTLPQVTLRGSAIYDITSELHNEIVGGACSLSVQVRDSAAIVYPFSIRAKNPLDATARAYITANVDVEFRSYAWMIAKHESKLEGRVYNQFNPSGNSAELPNWGAPHGWGIAQIDKGRNGDTTAEVYDWHANVAAMNTTLISKRRRYNEIIGLYRAAYQNDPSTHWTEPDNVTTNVNGTVISGRQWAIMTLYNGSGGTHPLPFAGHSRERTPIHFDPATTNWVLFTNSKNYVPVVYGDANATEVE